MDQEKLYKAQCMRALQTGKVTATEYRHGAVVNGWPSRWPSNGNPQKGKRGIVRSMSARSMIRASFQISNSPADFDLMTVLTFRQAHPNPKECLRAWCLKIGLNTPAGTPWGWAMEYQERGIVHYHIIHTLTHLRDRYDKWPPRWNIVMRKGHYRSVLQGNLGRHLQNEWIKTVGDTSTEFRRFQYGGITERMDRPDLTARYLGGYIGKAAQKMLPDSEPPNGRWWWLSEAARPIVGKTYVLDNYPLDRPHHLVFDKAKLFTEGTGRLTEVVPPSVAADPPRVGGLLNDPPESAPNGCGLDFPPVPNGWRDAEEGGERP